MDEEAIFITALEMESADLRAAYLDEACAGSTELRRKVEELLVAHGRAGKFLDNAAVAWNAQLLIADRQARAERPGTVIGPYKLLEQIGEGGMGLVFMAEQSRPVRRRVALKIIKPGMDTRQVVIRFEAERQALALMDHPNIAHVFDGGTTDTGRPYFVMELVRGVSITEFCDQRRLTTQQRLELFVTVCQAVQHAHQKGIIHRDLKPSNVLVTLHDTVAVPKIIDFGIAKATTQPLTERTLFTNFAQMMGTPLYMSPEQAEMNGLDVDTRSDVYSLGVLLYELLTGTTPFESQTLKQVGLDEMRRMIREEEPPTPSQRLSTLNAQVCDTVSEQRGVDRRRLGKVLRGELDWIVMKALEKDRNRRYESASAFVADVQRYLDDEPVQACPPSAAYRFRKFARKNRKPLVLAGGFVLLLATATLVSTWQAIRATRAETKARQAETLAEERFEMANEAVDKYLDEVTETPELKNANFHELRIKLLETALPFYQKLAEQAPGDPEREAARGRAYRRLADIHLVLGEADAALAHYQKMHAIVAPLAEAFPGEPAYRRDQSRSLIRQGQILSHTGRIAEGEPAYRAALAVVQHLVNDFPSNPEYRSDLGKIHYGLAFTLGIGQGKLAEAETEARAAIRELQRLADECPNVPEYRSELGLSHHYLTGILERQGKKAKAESVSRAALKISQRLVDEYPHVPEYRCLLSGTLRYLGEYRAALKEIEQLVGEPSNVPNYRLQLAECHREFGEQLAKQGKLAEAEGEYRAAIKERQRLAREDRKYPNAHHHFELAGDRRSLAAIRRNLGQLLIQQGKGAEAEAEYRAWLKDYQRRVEANPEKPEFRRVLFDCYRSLGKCLVQQGKKAEAESEYRTAITHYQCLADENANVHHYRNVVAVLHDHLGTLLAGLDKPGQAETEYRAAIKIGQRLADKHANVPHYHSNLAIYHKELGLVLLSQGKQAEAETEYRAEIQSYKRAADEKPNDTHSNNNLAWELVTCPHPKLRDPGQAVAHAKKAVELRPDFSAAWNTLGLAQYRSGDVKAAVAALTKSVQLSNGGSSIDFFFLAMAHWQLNDKEKARDWYDRAVAWMDKNSPQNEELKRFRAEATALLGLAKAADVQNKKK